jgi:hypothetical protein
MRRSLARGLELPGPRTITAKSPGPSGRLFFCDRNTVRVRGKAAFGTVCSCLSREMVLFQGYGKALVSQPLAQIPLVEQVCCSNAYYQDNGAPLFKADEG